MKDRGALMKRIIRAVGTVAAVFFLVSSALAEEINKGELPVPDRTGGKPLMQALQARRSERL